MGSNFGKFSDTLFQEVDGTGKDASLAAAQRDFERFQEKKDLREAKELHAQTQNLDTALDQLMRETEARAALVEQAQTEVRQDNPVDTPPGAPLAAHDVAGVFGGLALAGLLAAPFLRDESSQSLSDWVGEKAASSEPSVDVSSTSSTSSDAPDRE